MPITAIAVLSFSDMACSLSLVPQGHYTPRGFSMYLRTFANLLCAMD